jgi:hypothetical protein
MKINNLRRWGNSRGATVAALKHSPPLVARLKPQTVDFHRLTPTGCRLGDAFFAVQALFITDCVSDPLAVQMALPFVVTFYRDKK